MHPKYFSPIGAQKLYTYSVLGGPPIYVGVLRTPTPPLRSASGLRNYWLFNKDLIKKLINREAGGRHQGGVWGRSPPTEMGVSGGARGQPPEHIKSLTPSSLNPWSARTWTNLAGLLASVLYTECRRFFECLLVHLLGLTCKSLHLITISTG